MWSAHFTCDSTVSYMNKRIQDKQVTQNIDVTITKADKFDTKKQASIRTYIQTCT